MYPKSNTVQAKGCSSSSTPAGHPRVSTPATKATKATKAAPARRRIQVRRSGVHGKGVFAAADLRKGEVLVEYVGEVIEWDEALRRHPHDPAQPDHTFYFHIEDGRVIDANVGGNAARWINHSCAPNCEADEAQGRVFIKALRSIKAGEELFYNYGLTIDERYTLALKKKFACHCGARACRGTMLSPKR
jgi:SET domain-containing protein